MIVRNSFNEQKKHKHKNEQIRQIRKYRKEYTVYMQKWNKHMYEQSPRANTSPEEIESHTQTNKQQKSRAHTHTGPQGKLRIKK